MVAKNPPPQYVDSDDESIPPPPPPVDAFTDNQSQASGGMDRTLSTNTAKPVKKWRLLKKEAEHVLVPQDEPQPELEPTETAPGLDQALMPMGTSPNANANVPMQGHFRGTYNAQQFDEEEAGMDEIEVPSSSVVARLQQSEVDQAQKKKYCRYGMIACVAICVLIAVITGSVVGTRGRDRDRGGNVDGVEGVENGNEIDNNDNAGGGAGGGENNDNDNDIDIDVGIGNDVLNADLETPTGVYLMQSDDVPPSVKASLSDPASSGAGALDWLLTDPSNEAYNLKGLDNLEDGPERDELLMNLNQRLAAASLGKAFGVEDMEGWMSEEDVCDWEGIDCAGADVDADANANVPEDAVGAEDGGQGYGYDMAEDYGYENNMAEEGYGYENAYGYGNRGNRKLQAFNRKLQGVNPNAIVGLSLHERGLKGTIPVEILLLTDLKSISLYSNELTGPIPPELGDLGLKGLDLYDNQFSGAIPEEIFSESMVGLYLSKNNLDGPIPDVSDMMNLQAIWLDENKLTGFIPKEFGDMMFLQDLRLHGNELEGEIPKELGYAESLVTMNLAGNYLVGEIPATFGNLENLKNLWFMDNFNIYRVQDDICDLGVPILEGGCDIQECNCCTDICGTDQTGLN